MNDGKKTIHEFINRIFCRVKLLLMLYSKDLDTCINQERSENIKKPLKSFNQNNTNRNENDPENNGHQNSYQQCPRDMISVDFEKTKDQNENKNIINAKAPLHQVSTHIFK